MARIFRKQNRTFVARPLLLVTMFFLATRLVVLAVPQPASDVGIYARYAWEFRTASDQDLPFYELHARNVEQREAEAREAGTLVAPLDEYRDVEYPPLALAFLRVPTLWMGDAPTLGEEARAFEARYYFAFRVGMAVIDGALFLLLAGLLHQLFPAACNGERARRLGMYTATTLALGHLLYDRLDLLLAALILLALALLVRRLHYGWSFAVLAAAISFKLVPVVLVPLWVVGSMPADRPLDFRNPRVLGQLTVRAVVLLILVGGCLLSFYSLHGARSLGFLAYHRARPLEVGSLSGSLPLVLGILGQPLTVAYSYGSVNLRSPLTPALAALAPWLTAGTLLALACHSGIHFRRAAASSAGAAPAGATLAQRQPHAVVCYALLFLMAFIVTNKVFSPQYLLWLAPLVALLPFEGRERGRFTGAFLLVCALSTLLVPFLFVSDLIDPAGKTVPLQPRPPTVRLVLFTVLRNALFAGLAVFLAVRLSRSLGKPIPGSPSRENDPGRDTG